MDKYRSNTCLGMELILQFFSLLNPNLEASLFLFWNLRTYNPASLWIHTVVKKLKVIESHCHTIGKEGKEIKA